MTIETGVIDHALMNSWLPHARKHLKLKISQHDNIPIRLA